MFLKVLRGKRKEKRHILFWRVGFAILKPHMKALGWYHTHFLWMNDDDEDLCFGKTRAYKRSVTHAFLPCGSTVLDHQLSNNYWLLVTSILNHYTCTYQLSNSNSTPPLDPPRKNIINFSKHHQYHFFDSISTPSWVILGSTSMNNTEKAPTCSCITNMHMLLKMFLLLFIDS